MLDFYDESLTVITLIDIRTKLEKPLKKILNCCKLQIVSKNKIKLGNKIHLNDQIPRDLTSGVVCKFQCGLCNESHYGECVRHLNVRIGGHILNSWLKNVSFVYERLWKLKHLVNLGKISLDKNVFIWNVMNLWEALSTEFANEAVKLNLFKNRFLKLADWKIDWRFWQLKNTFCLILDYNS